MKAKQRENGIGSVEFDKSKTKPYRAKARIGTEVDSRGRYRTKYKIIGNFYTKSEAEAALQDYSRNPYDVSSSIKTFSDLYQAWFEDVRIQGISEGYGRTIECAYAYCSSLYDMPLRFIGPGHIKDAMYKGYIIDPNQPGKSKKRYASICTQERIKSMCNMMFDYAMERNLVSQNPSRAFKITKLLHDIEDNRKIKKVYTLENVSLFWKHVDDIPNTDMILIALYTGFRPQELLRLETKNINLHENRIIGGMKTVNGKNRVVPIHPLIKPLIRERMRQEKRFYHTGKLFNDNKRPDDPEFTYDKYRHRFHEIMLNYHLEGFSPHCTRHTFASQAKRCQIDSGIIKRILGHSLRGDITESVYIHPTLPDLIREMKKLTYDIAQFESEEETNDDYSDIDEE